MSVCEELFKYQTCVDVSVLNVCVCRRSTLSWMSFSRIYGRKWRLEWWGDLIIAKSQNNSEMEMKVRQTHRWFNVLHMWRVGQVHENRFEGQNVVKLVLLDGCFSIHTHMCPKKWICETFSNDIKTKPHDFIPQDVSVIAQETSGDLTWWF